MSLKLKMKQLIAYEDHITQSFQWTESQVSVTDYRYACQEWDGM